MRKLTATEMSLGGVSARRTYAKLVDGVRGLTGAVEQLVRAAAGEAVRRARVLLADLRRTGARQKRLRVVDSLALGGKRHLLLVRCDDQEYLVGTGAESVETIVLRQPEPMHFGEIRAGAGAIQAREMQAGTVQAETVQPDTMQSGAGLPGAAQARPAALVHGAMRRGNDGRNQTSGLWLVTPDSQGAAEIRIQEADSGKGRELWR